MDTHTTEYEELIHCGYCKQKYNDTDHSPKLLSCKHYFCLQCVRTTLNKGQELYCINCWKRTELGGDCEPDTLPTYTPVLCLTKNFSQLKLNNGGLNTTNILTTTNTNGCNGTSNNGLANGKPPDKTQTLTSQQQQASPAPPPPQSQPNTQSQASTTGVPPPQPPSSSSSQPPTHKMVISENCHTHAMPLALWCHTCCAPVCRACATTSDHTNHQIKSQNEAKDHIIHELQHDLNAMNKMLNEIQRLAIQQREFLLKILEACVTLKTHIETDLTNNATHFELNDTRDILNKLRINLTLTENLSDVHNLYSNIHLEKQRLQLRYQDMYLQCQLDDLIRNSGIIFDFGIIKQALSNLQNGDLTGTAAAARLMMMQQQSQPTTMPHQNPILFLANYCMSQLYSRHMIAKQNDYHMNTYQMAPSMGQPPPPPPHHLVLPQPSTLQSQTKNLYGNNGADGLMLLPSSQPSGSPSTTTTTQIRAPITMCPLYYFQIEVNGTTMGRIVIEVRVDVAPKMSKNFGVLTTGEMGMGYKGCHIFQCWDGESVITGDFELNNGRGGRSIFEDSYFLPDDTKLIAVRGTVGMRRTQKRHDNLGMVGSQFRIILQEMRGFTGIFGQVVEGLELVEKISTYGDTAGKPTKSIIISKCGKL